MQILDEKKVCPLCGGDNGCQHGKETCWCNEHEFPEHVLDMIPEDKKGKACICRACLEKYSKNN